jgi:hypothetical protein
MIEVEDATPPAPTTLDGYPNQDFTDSDISVWGTEGDVTLSHDAAGYLVATVTNLGSNPWDANIGVANQDIVAGNTYTVTYVLKTGFAEGRDVTFFAENTNNGYSKYFEETRTLTNEFQTFVFTFTPDADNDDTKLGMFVGNTTNAVLGDVIIDSITVTVEEPMISVWTGYNMTVVEGDLGENDVTITYDGVSDPWWNDNAQFSNFVYDGTKDFIDFTFTGTDGAPLVFKVEGWGAALEGRITADGTEQTFVLDLSTLTPEQRNDISLIIIFVESPGATGTLALSFDGIVQPTT